MSTEKRVSIGAIARAAGIPEGTLRTWERRYGFPEPIRLPSGHRRYSLATVPKLKLMAAAKDAGLQPSESASMTEDELRDFLNVGSIAPPVDEHPWLPHVRRMDDTRLDALCRRAWTQLGAERFVAEALAPLLANVGELWARGELSVAEEHWLSERVRNLLSTEWAAMSAQNDGPPYVCATLPGEQHELGLHMVATVLATHGARIIYLGANTPIDAIASTVASHAVDAVCISVSGAAPPFQTQRVLAQLRDRLPANIGLVVGGEGSVSGEGITRVTSWGDLVADISHRSSRRTS